MYAVRLHAKYQLSMQPTLLCGSSDLVHDILSAANFFTSNIDKLIQSLIRRVPCGNFFVNQKREARGTEPAHFNQCDPIIPKILLNLLSLE